MILLILRCLFAGTITAYSAILVYSSILDMLILYKEEEVREILPQDLKILHDRAVARVTCESHLNNKERREFLKFLNRVFKEEIKKHEIDK